MDVNEPDQIAAVAADLEQRWGALDGVLHAIAFAPGDALGNNFLNTPVESAQTAFATSAYSLKALSVAMLPTAREGRHGSIVGLDFDAQVAWPVYDWMGVAKAALESVNRYLARDLGAEGNPLQPRLGGPDRHDGRQVDPRLQRARPGVWNTMAPLHWDTADAGPSPTRSCSCCQASRAASPARSRTSTAAFTRWARRGRPTSRSPSPRPASRPRATTARPARGSPR